jgi:uncharacterized protein involved in exopolysaccharide biosynthesis
MTDTFNQQQRLNDEIDLRELFAAIWQGKWLIIAVTVVFTVAAVFYALSLPNIYKSEALLAPVSEDAGLKIPGQLGGLAALAGVNLGGLGGGDKTGLAMEIIKSREFLGRFIETHDLFIAIMAAEGWNRSDNSLVIDSEIYNTSTDQWVRDVKPPYQPKPSVLEVHEELLKLFAISQDKTSGMVKISVEHYSPYLAKQWVDKLVQAINEEMRNRELSEAQRSISYLNSQIEQTNIADVRTMLYSLIEEQTKTVMLANVRDEYVFKTVDPAVVAEKKAKPKRALIVVLAIMLGSLLSMMFVLVRYFSDKK